MLTDTRSNKIAITEELRNLIVEERLASKKSAAQVAEALDRSQSWIAQIENGRKQKVSGKELISLISEIKGSNRQEAVDFLNKQYFSPFGKPLKTDPAEQMINQSLQQFCEIIYQDYRIADSIRKQSLLTALENLSDNFFDFFMKEYPEEIDIYSLSVDEYNRLLLSKPLVGGVYRVPLAHLAPIEKQLERYDYQDSILCGVIDNSIHKPAVTQSTIIPILPALAKDTSATHCTFRLFGSKYIALGELCSVLENNALQELIAFSSIEEFSSMLHVIYRHNQQLLPAATPGELVKQLKPYFNHIFNHQKLLLRM